MTGSSGYLATHCVQQLLQDGYKVRGTVRSLKNKAKVDPLRSLEFANERLELIEADLENIDSWKSAVKDCDYVLHTASPFPIIADESIVKTAVDGTLAVLKACAKEKSVKKVVLTSSCAAVNGKLTNVVNVHENYLQRAMRTRTESLPKKTGLLRTAPRYWPILEVKPLRKELPGTLSNPFQKEITSSL